MNNISHQGMIKIQPTQKKQVNNFMKVAQPVSPMLNASPEEANNGYCLTPEDVLKRWGGGGQDYSVSSKPSGVEDKGSNVFLVPNNTGLSHYNVSPYLCPIV